VELQLVWLLLESQLDEARNLLAQVAVAVRQLVARLQDLVEEQIAVLAREKRKKKKKREEKKIKKHI
jgi:hypothetical protein